MNKKYLNVPYYIWGLFLYSAVVFIFFPQIDLFISNLFYDGKDFPFNGTWVESFFYFSVKPIILVLAASTILIFLYNFFGKKNILNVNAKVALYIFLVFGIAPGLIVNVTLKDNWQRARPSQTTNFGGTKEFTPAFIPADQGGYSFSSGHAAAAFSLMGFVLLAKKRKKVWMSIVLLYGVGVSLARIASGGHFFSDVITSFFIVYIFTYMLYGLLIKEEERV